MDEILSFTVKEALLEEKDILLNLYTLYGHDISEFTKQSEVNERGLFELEDADEFINDEFLKAYLIWIKDKPAGFLLMGLGENALDGCDFIIYDFFILRKYRKICIASKVIQGIFAENPGKYCVSDLEINTPSVEFWRSVIKQYDSDYVEESFVTPMDEKFLFQIFEVKP